MPRISFLSGTRADYSKIKPYIEYLIEKKGYDVFVFATGMHMLTKYGETYREIKKDFGKKIHLVLDPSFQETSTAQETAHIISAYDTHLGRDKIDFVFVHGDRPEALAGAIAARLNNIPLCQIEAGDLSGSIDDSIRHAITKLSHQFLVSDKAAESILLQLGEKKSHIFIAGNSSLANIIPPVSASDRTQIPYDQYAILIYHPVTTLSAKAIRDEIKTLMKELEHSGLNYVVILPNNDRNHQVILDEYKKYAQNPRFCFFKSLPLELFTALLKKALFLVGNSSCGIKEAPYYQVPCIDIGSRQHNRYWDLKLDCFHHTDHVQDLNSLIQKIIRQKQKKRPLSFRRTFFKRLDRFLTPTFWRPDIQKEFRRLAFHNRQKSAKH